MPHVHSERRQTWLRDFSILASLRPDDARRLVDAARRFQPDPGEVLYPIGAAAERAYLVLSGAVELRATPRGETEATVLRRVIAGEAFGLEAAFGARTRHAEVVAGDDCELLELPAELLARSVRRSEGASQLERAVRRQVTDERLRTLAFTRALPEGERRLLLDMVRSRRLERGQRIYSQGQRADAMFLIASGMVRLYHLVDGARHLRAYLSTGDFFGETEALSGERYRLHAEATGPVELLVLPREQLLTLTARNPGLLEQMQRVSFQREADQADAFEDADAGDTHRTRHLFQDLYRVSVATELLAIDLETCVSCGTCAWSCHETHGQARLVRRGDKVLAPDDMRSISAGHRLLLPNSCQHCRDPECMIDCPTGAIGRDPEGEVFIRESICTGCEACAKACPWDNIQIAPAPAAHDYSQIAVKCDLCHGYDGVSACVANCPTGAIVRLDPLAESATLQAMLGAPRSDTSEDAADEPTSRLASPAPILLTSVALFAVAGALAHSRGALAPYTGAGLWSGILAALSCLGLAAFGVRKRLIGRWMRRRRERDAPRPMRPLSRWYRWHLGLGAGLIALIMLHTGGGFGGGLTTSLMLCLIASVVLGASAAALYRLIPPRVARLVPAPHLPEDHPAERRRLDFELRETFARRDEARARFDATLGPLWGSRAAAWRVLLEGPDRHALRRRLEGEALGDAKRDVATTYALEKAARLTTERLALDVERLGTRLLAAPILPHLLASTSALAFLIVHAIQGVLWL